MRRLALLLFLCSALPAAAQDTPTPPATDKPAQAPEKREPVCRNVKSASSRLGGVKECRTQEEWDALSTVSRSKK
jgi:hypothetical protein